LHPVVGFVYFAVIIGFSMFFMHPVCLAVSFICAVAYARRFPLYLLPVLVLTAVMNPLFNHRGATILAYLPNGNPLTLESAAFGLASAVMLVTVITWFSCVNAVMTSDKIVYLFGRLSPAFSLLLAMALRFVPRFREQLSVISDAQKAMHQPRGIKTLSILVTWSLENAIETADSMKARGYGLPGRTAFSVFRFTRRDGYAAAYIAVCTALILAAAGAELYRFRYFPTIRGYGHIGAFAVYAALAAFPIMLSLKEALTWKRIESKT